MIQREINERIESGLVFKLVSGIGSLACKFPKASCFVGGLVAGAAGRTSGRSYEILEATPAVPYVVMALIGDATESKLLNHLSYAAGVALINTDRIVSVANSLY